MGRRPSWCLGRPNGRPSSLITETTATWTIRKAGGIGGWPEQTATHGGVDFARSQGLQSPGGFDQFFAATDVYRAHLIEGNSANFGRDALGYGIIHGPIGSVCDPILSLLCTPELQLGLAIQGLTGDPASPLNYDYPYAALKYTLPLWSPPSRAEPLPSSAPCRFSWNPFASGQCAMLA